MSYLNVNSGPSYGALDTDEQIMDREDQRLLYGAFADGEQEDRHYDTDDDLTSESEVQEGVRKIEAISRTWTQRALVVAYLRLVT